MVSQLKVGLTLTIVAWLGLLTATVHGKYVVEQIAAGEYDKGPLWNDEHPAWSDVGERTEGSRSSSERSSDVGDGDE